MSGLHPGQQDSYGLSRLSMSRSLVSRGWSFVFLHRFLPLLLFFVWSRRMLLSTGFLCAL